MTTSEIIQQKVLRDGGAVIIDDGSPLQPLPKIGRVARGRAVRTPMFMYTTDFNVDGLTRPGFPEHPLYQLKTDRLELTHGASTYPPYDWDEVKSFAVETMDDEILGKLKPGELELSARFKLNKHDSAVNLYAAETGPIFRIEIKFKHGGKIEIVDYETQTLRLELFFTK